MTYKNINLFIGVDFGGTSLKSILYNRNGDALATGYAVVPRISVYPGWQDLDMIAVWEAAKQTLKDIVAQIGDLANNIRAIGLTGAGFGAWLIDEEGHPVRPGIPWTDNRAEDILAEWQAKGIADRYFAITGSGLIKTTTAVLVKWLSIHEPESLKKARYALMAQEWIHYKLSNDVRTDATGASINVGDIRTNEYSEELLDLMGISEYKYLFPPIRSSFEATGLIVPKVAKEIGLPLTVKINNAPTDITSCSVGVGNIKDGDVSTNMGTALGNLFVTEELHLERFINAQNCAVGTPQVTYVHSVIPNFAAPNQEWFINNFCGEDRINSAEENLDLFSYLAKKVAEIPVGSDGLLYNPLICAFGQSLPFMHRTDSSHFIGINQLHTRFHLLRAVYEGVALAARRTYENSGLRPKVATLSGGGARSDLWCQIFSDVLGIPTRVPSDEEWGAKGAAISAAYAAGYFAEYSQAVSGMVHYTRHFEPNELNHQKYNKIYELFKEVYESLIPIWDKLNNLKKHIS